MTEFDELCFQKTVFKKQGLVLVIACLNCFTDGKAGGFPACTLGGVML